MTCIRSLSSAAIDIAALVSCVALLLSGCNDQACDFSPSSPAPAAWGFDDGTLQGWRYLTPAGDAFPEEDSAVTWIVTEAVINVDFPDHLLQSPEGPFRIVPIPYPQRDCKRQLCLSQLLRSPRFFLDGGGELSIDMMGGKAQGSLVIEDVPGEPPPNAEWLEERRHTSGLQGFALRDASTGQYELHGFSSVTNDGFTLSSNVARANWDTVVLSEEQLAPYVSNGRCYEIDVFDSYAGGWGWIGFDNVQVPGAAE